MKISEIYHCIDAFAPFNTALDWDNTGLLVGGMGDEVTGVLLALDITAKTVETAVAAGCNLIISHHPVIFSPLSHLQRDSLPYLLAQNGIAALCAHTNLDAANGGVNDALSAALGLLAVTPLPDPNTPGKPPTARLGKLAAPMTAQELAACVKAQLGAAAVRFSPVAGEISTVAVCGGGCADFWREAAGAGAQALITGDGKHHQFLDAAGAGFCLVDAGHFDTEVVVIPVLHARLKAAFPELKLKIFKESAPFQSL